MNQAAQVAVYKATNRVNGHFYIGYSARGLAARERQHRAIARQGLGNHLHAAMRKYGAENFVFETVADFEGDTDLAKIFECEAIQGWQPQYNISYGGDGHYVSLESRKKIGDANRGKKASEETRAKLRAARKGRTFSEESRRKMSVAHKGRKVSEDTREKMRAWERGPEMRAKLRAASTGKPQSEETRAKLRAINLGKKDSEDTKRKKSAALKGRPAHNKGKPHKPETVEKMRASQLGKVRTEEARANMRAAQVVNRKPVKCVTDGRVFASSSEAEKFYGLCQAAVTRVVSGRIKSTRGLQFIRWVEPK